MKKRVFTWPILLILSAGTAGALMWTNTGSLAQVVVVLGFLLICPGMMAVRFLALEEPLTELTLAVTLSLAIDTFVAGLLLMARSWSPHEAFNVILIITVVGAAIDGARLFPSWRARTKRLRELVNSLIARKSATDSIDSIHTGGL